MFQNSSDWTLIFSNTLSGTFNNPIPEIEPLHIFTSLIIGIQVTSASAGDTWIKGGYLSQVLDAPLGMAGMAEGERLFIPLYTPKIIKFLLFPAPYKVSFQAPKYFRDCTLSIWEFIGD
ncbi:hypothetical protein [Cylindrospermum sp. FACHB-282]|uniref:hypothetical protein n=1 Tax=Cylindrospermum sp. FACHB-282 TaxID=2692794 RepID=UPI001687A235|nr:hypothetical protein [Cylindrospermum sp. FACHB-282]MBD2385256.1 hypothetical protein [Cylindrospermum sp. FACHB-282]